MTTKKLLLLGLLFTTTAVNAQVVYGQDEQDYVKGTRVTTTTMPTTVTQTVVDTNNKYHLSGIGDNWFLSVKGGASVYLGQPKGCGDLFDKTKGTMVFSLGKWHSRFFGTRLVYQGFRTKGATSCFGFHNLHADMMINLSSFFRTTYDPLPKWNLIPYLGFGGIIRTGELHKHPFALSYGAIVSYRATKRLHISAEIGGTSTYQDFDGVGKAKHFGDNLLQASIGVAIGIGKQGWEKKKGNALLPVETVSSTTVYAKNDYEGLRRLKERMENPDSTEVSDNIAKFSAPIMFFFKINTAKLVDQHQLVNINEIATAVKQYGLKIKVAGAADSKTGTPKINRALSIKRAKYIVKLLLKAGVPKESMMAVSEGGIDWYKPYPANRHTCVIVYREK